MALLFFRRRNRLIHFRTFATRGDCHGLSLREMPASFEYQATQPKAEAAPSRQFRIINAAPFRLLCKE